MSVITEKGDITSSFLVVQLARPSDAGIYTCSPAIGKPVSVNVHVLRGKQIVCSKDENREVSVFLITIINSYTIHTENNNCIHFICRRIQTWSGNKLCFYPTTKPDAIPIETVLSHIHLTTIFFIHFHFIIIICTSP